MNHLEKFDTFIVNNKRAAGLIAAGAVGYVALKALSKAACLFKKFVLPGYNLIERYGKGSYAAVTACTEGIGKGFVLELAKRGFNLVMFVRNVEKAQALVEEIKKTINDKIDVKIVQIDFLKVNQPGVVQAAIKQVEDIDISLLVNNAGMSITNKLSIETFTEEEISNMIVFNIYTQVLFTYYLLPKLRNRGKKSGIINLSSIATVISMGGFHVYTSTKTFNDYFSKSMGEEYKGFIDVMSLKPGFVDTPQVQQVKEKKLCITPQECANAALNNLGRYEETYGHYKHMYYAFLTQNFQDVIKNNIRKMCQAQREKKQISQ
ncbi:oxidoreductase, short chain dehydrogenase/reductase family protein (macronuclear) [Tetrahymena thermophila SB210]|uniref:Oxidoreductase, short chain dehydrogenase/reductase family protein n=1 Tax=Tetrahymena thermophila (strain SB210) TaxID=312017 RepID=Q22R61_TETTS|nr:oxidoreductase, short chain dehydrogenase/reductase family protein [Tetrahymena thermophila SB210]EAR88261.1 oxidoreductase, short chain dehydrogenase/reductase family protein [Tetrahymena thermophila SB210]|eukprot:XP_001008506.1 oxidoreductase, short chain dehydrogenase/reductase family protein [Tetrahymena thermophila SB210]